MNLKQLLANAQFLISAANPPDLPPDLGAEIAFAGRSNAGKSSVLNKICTRKQLARSSKTPGRTQLINFFALSEQNKLVDLPGYGYAKASQAKQRQWNKLLEYYFTERTALRGTVLVMDVRHPLQQGDQAMLEWCVYHQCDVHILLNKADKLSRQQGLKQLNLVKKSLQDYSSDMISQQLFSATTGIGMDDMLIKLNSWLFEGN